MTARAFIGTNSEAFRVARRSIPGPRDYLLECEHPSGWNSNPKLLKLLVFRGCAGQFNLSRPDSSAPERGR